jgi:hypothetical protein
MMFSDHMKGHMSMTSSPLTLIVVVLCIAPVLLIRWRFASTCEALNAPDRIGRRNDLLP